MRRTSGWKLVSIAMVLVPMVGCGSDDNDGRTNPDPIPAMNDNMKLPDNAHVVDHARSPDGRGGMLEGMLIDMSATPNGTMEFLMPRKGRVAAGVLGGGDQTPFVSLRPGAAGAVVEEELDAGNQRLTIHAPLGGTLVVLIDSRVSPQGSDGSGSGAIRQALAAPGSLSTVWNYVFRGPNNTDLSCGAIRAVYASSGNNCVGNYNSFPSCIIWYGARCTANAE
jgi:hypothetical protein